MRRILAFALCLLLSSQVGWSVGGVSVSKGVDAAQDLGKAVTLSEKDAVDIGKRSAAAYDAQNKIADKNSDYAKRLERVTKGLNKEDGLNLNFAVYMVKDVNAFALPDGSIRVYSGLMDMMTEDDELMFIVGHEIGHVKNKDSYGRMKQVYATSGAFKAASAAGGTVGAITDSQLGDLAKSFINAQYSQKQEYAADLYGYNMMKKYKKKHQAAATSLRKLATLGDKGSVLSSHPQSSKRAARLEEMK